MEIALLKEMIHDRDRRIATIKHKMEDSYHRYLQKETVLMGMRQARKKSSFKNGSEIEALSIEKYETEGRLNRMLGHLKKQQGAAVNLYTNIINNQANNQNGSVFSLRSLASFGTGGAIQAKPTKIDSSMVMRMQAQLCKVMHSMGIVDNQLILLREKCNDLIAKMKQMLSETSDEKTKVELQLMNELMIADGEIRAEKEKFKIKSDEMKKQIKHLERKNRRQRQRMGYDDESESESESESDSDMSSSDEDSDEHYESDAEMDHEDEQRDNEEKNALRLSLTERRKDISELEKEIDDQKEMMRAVKVRLSLRDLELNFEDDGKNKKQQDLADNDIDKSKEEIDTNTEGESEKKNPNNHNFTYGLKAVNETDFEDAECVDDNEMPSNEGGGEITQD